jgi:hypothetical protein
MMAAAHRAVLAATALAALLGGAGPARADWIVTREGARMETRGPWEVRGKLVVFTAPDGTLASVRLAAVDLEASRQATEEVRRPKPAPPPVAAKRKSVVSITDKDFPKPAPAPAAPAEAAPAEGGAAAPAAAPPASRSLVRVETWEQKERAEGDGIEITGVLRNEGSDIATEVALAVSTRDETGAQTGAVEAVLSAATLEPRGTATFRAMLPGVFTFSGVNFDVRSKGLKLQTVDPN